MEQLMEPLVQGPRHAKPVTTMGRVKHALNKGPARWSMKTYLGAIAVSIAVVVALGVAVGFAVVGILTILNNR